MTKKILVQFCAVAALAMCAQQATALDLNLDPFMSSTRVGQPKSDVGVDMKADDLDLRGAITTKLAGNTTLIVPQLTSTYVVDRKWRLETRTVFSNWNEQ